MHGRALLVALDYLLKLKIQLKKCWTMDWLREFYIFFQNTSRRFLPVSSGRVFERCFKEYFFKKYLNVSKENFGSGQQFYCKRAASGYNFTKTVLQDSFFRSYFRNFRKKLLSDIFSHYRGVFGTQLKIYDGTFW